jgi:hypothetical protein
MFQELLNVTQADVELPAHKGITIRRQTINLTIYISSDPAVPFRRAVPREAGNCGGWIGTHLFCDMNHIVTKADLFFERHRAVFLLMR